MVDKESFVMAYPSKVSEFNFFHDVAGVVNQFDPGICSHSLLIVTQVVTRTKILSSQNIEISSPLLFVSFHISHPYVSTGLITFLSILLFDVPEKFLDLMVLFRHYLHLFTALNSPFYILCDVIIGGDCRSEVIKTLYSIKMCLLWRFILFYPISSACLCIAMWFSPHWLFARFSLPLFLFCQKVPFMVGRVFPTTWISFWYASSSCGPFVVTSSVLICAVLNTSFRIILNIRGVNVFPCLRPLSISNDWPLEFFFLLIWMYQCIRDNDFSVGY